LHSIKIAVCGDSWATPTIKQMSAVHDLNTTMAKDVHRIELKDVTSSETNYNIIIKFVNNNQ
jgi:hypothetical protein